MKLFLSKSHTGDAASGSVRTDEIVDLTIIQFQLDTEEQLGRSA